MTTLRNFHIPLPEKVYDELREVAEHLHHPATQLGREAIENWLKQPRQALLVEAIRAYAEEAAGTEADLDRTLEAASIENLAADEDHRA